MSTHGQNMKLFVPPPLQPMTSRCLIPQPIPFHNYPTLPHIHAHPIIQISTEKLMSNIHPRHSHPHHHHRMTVSQNVQRCLWPIPTELGKGFTKMHYMLPIIRQRSLVFNYPDKTCNSLRNIQLPHQLLC